MYQKDKQVNQNTGNSQNIARRHEICKKNFFIKPALFAVVLSAVVLSFIHDEMFY